MQDFEKGVGNDEASSHEQTLYGIATLCSTVHRSDSIKDLARKTKGIESNLLLKFEASGGMYPRDIVISVLWGKFWHNLVRTACIFFLYY